MPSSTSTGIQGIQGTSGVPSRLNPDAVPFIPMFAGSTIMPGIFENGTNLSMHAGNGSLSVANENINNLPMMPCENVTNSLNSPILKVNGINSHISVENCTNSHIPAENGTNSLILAENGAFSHISAENDANSHISVENGTNSHTPAETSTNDPIPAENGTNSYIPAENGTNFSIPSENVTNSPIPAVAQGILPISAASSNVDTDLYSPPPSPRSQSSGNSNVNPPSDNPLRDGYSDFSQVTEVLTSSSRNSFPITTNLDRNPKISEKTENFTIIEATDHRNPQNSETTENSTVVEATDLCNPRSPETTENSAAGARGSSNGADWRAGGAIPKSRGTGQRKKHESNCLGTNNKSVIQQLDDQPADMGTTNLPRISAEGRIRE